MTKQEKLEKLDNKVLDFMLDCMENETTELLTEVNTIVQYLGKNNKVEEKSKGSLQDDMKERVLKRKKRESKPS